jgi:hypothetical protein
LHTVVAGDTVEQIPVRFLGVLEDAAGPGHDLYLVELEGPTAERVGVAAGMSGSPVYMDGRLIGALAYRYGVLPKRAVGGVTPIEQMRDASRLGGRAAPQGAGVGPRPIATPVTMGGLAAEVRQWLAPQLDALGWISVAGGGRAATPAQPRRLEPGMAVAVRLVGGDLSVAAIGTVTLVEGDTVYAFGHPFFGSGRVSLPMAMAEVVHTVPDAVQPFRLSNLGEEVGAILEDRITAVVGRTGVRAPMIPVEVRVEGGTYGTRSLHYDVVDHPELVPPLVGAVTASSLLANTGFDASSTVLGSGAVELRGLPTLPLGMAFSGDPATNPALAVATRVQAVLHELYRNRFRVPEVQGIRLDLRVSLDRLQYEVVSLLHDRSPVEPGQELGVDCMLWRYRGEALKRSLRVSIPRDLVPGTEVRLAVGDAGFVDRALGWSLSRRLSSARDLAGLVRALADVQSTHRLTAVLYRPAEGVVADGAVFAGLPPTARRLVRDGGARSRTEAVVLSRSDVELDGPLTGGQIAPLVVGRERRAREAP